MKASLLGFQKIKKDVYAVLFIKGKKIVGLPEHYEGYFTTTLTGNLLVKKGEKT